MNSSADLWACDTSVAVAALDATHSAHEPCRRVLVERRPTISGHAAFETYSVLTRLPLPLRLQPHQAAEVLATAFPHPIWLDAPQASALWERMGQLELVGGSIYDALVATAALAHSHTLLTRDRRAEPTYRLVGVTYELII